MLQTGRLRVRIPVRSLDFFFSVPNFSSRIKALGLTQSLTEISAKKRPGSNGRPTRKADNLTAICASRLSSKFGSLDVSQPYGHPQSVNKNSFISYPTKPKRKVVGLCPVWAKKKQ
jgi:hypothetical protein